MISDEAAARAWLSGLPEWTGQAERGLQHFVEQLAAENDRQNLVSKPSLENVWARHIADSAQLLTYVSRETHTWLDMGTGAGFPGLVISILKPSTKVTLVESRRKRVEWLHHVVDDLGLDNVEIVGMRLEAMQTRKFDAISARAFAPLDKLLTLSARFSTKDTMWLLPKGRSAQQELDNLSGWTHTFHVKQSMTDRESGIIVGHLAPKRG